MIEVSFVARIELQEEARVLGEEKVLERRESCRKKEELWSVRGVLLK